MAAHDWLEGDVISNGIRMHFYRAGCATGIPIVLSHGSSDNGMCWISVAEALEREYDVIMPDARGHGLSEAPEQGYDPETMAADLAGLIRALRLPQPYVMGHSMGAGTSAICAANWPQLVSAAVLEDPPWWETPPAYMNNAARDQMVQRILEQRAMSREDLMAVGRREHPDWPEQELGPWADSKRQHSPNHMAAPRVPWVGFRELVPRIQCPTLLITADPGRGSLVTPAVAEEAAGLNPALRVAHIPDAGHNVRREQFGPYMVAVRAFLSDMDTSRQS